MGRLTCVSSPGTVTVNRDSSPNPDSVHDEASFLSFVATLAADRREAAKVPDAGFGAPRGWQNHTVDDFLDAALAWAHDSSFGRTQGLDVDASVWRRIAVFLHAGKIYE